MKKDCGEPGCRNDHRSQVLARGDEVIEQSGDFRLWQETDIPKYLGNVRYWVNSGKHVLASSISEFDPQETLAS